jgi:hypothetical protein
VSLRPQRKLIDDALIAQLETNNYAAAVEIANVLISAAKAGDVAAAKLIMERTEGKALQKVSFSGSEHDATPQKLVVQFVDAKGREIPSSGAKSQPSHNRSPGKEGIFENQPSGVTSRFLWNRPLSGSRLLP